MREGAGQKEALRLTLDPSREAAMLHFTGRAPQQLQKGEKAQRRRREKSFTREMEAAASRTGNIDYDTTHLGTFTLRHS